MIVEFKHILCPTDLSPESDGALIHAIALARVYGAKLSVCYVAGASVLADATIIQSGMVQPMPRTNLDRVFEQLVRRHTGEADTKSLDWEGFVADGDDVGETITREAADRRVDLIVMRSRRRPRRAALLGSTAESICRTAPCPVLVTHPDEREWIEPGSGKVFLKSILVAYDFSDYSEIALAQALSLAQEYQSELHLLHVLPPGSVSSPEVHWQTASTETAYHVAARRLQKSVPAEAQLWCNTTSVVREGQAYREILDYAEKSSVNLVCLGAHGSGFGMRALFGSNVDRVLRQAHCPVLVARPLRPSNFPAFDIHS